MKSKKNKNQALSPFINTWKILVIGICISGFIIFLGIFDYVRVTRACLSQLLDQYLEKVTQQEIDIINIKLKNNVKQINYAANLFRNVPEAGNEHKYLQFLKNNCDFDYIYLIDTDSHLYNIENDFVRKVSTADNFFSTLQPDKTIISNFIKDPVSGEQVCYIYEPLIDDGVITGCIYGVLLAETISKILQFSIFNQEGTTHIITKQGINIASSEMPQQKLYSDSIFAYFESTNQPYINVEKLRNDIEKNEAGTLHVITENGNWSICAYAPIGINDWYIFTSIPENTVDIYTAKLNNRSIALAIQLIIAFAIIAFLIAFRYNRNKNFLKDALLSSQKSAQILKMAVAHSQLSIFEYDIKTDKFSVLHSDHSIVKQLPQSCGKASSIFEKTDSISEEQKNVICEAFKTVKTSGKTFSFDIVSSQDSGPSTWYRITLSAIMTEKKAPSAIIGTIKDITEIKQTSIRYAQEDRFRKTMLAEYETCWSVNLSKKTILSVISNGKSVFEIPNTINDPYGEEAIDAACNNISPESKQTYLHHLMEPETLISLYENGTSQMQEKYICQGSWYTSIINLVEDPSTEELLVFVYTKNIDSETRKEQRLKFEAERDPLTKLYNRTTLEDKITNVLIKIEENQELCALFILDLDNFKNINDEYGHQAGDDVLKAVADELNSFSRKYDLIGRLGGDEFIGFIRELPSKQTIETLTARICSRLAALSLSNIPQKLISASIGIAFAPENGKTFAEMYSCADIALYDAKRKGKNQSAIYNPEAPPPRHFDA